MFRLCSAVVLFLGVFLSLPQPAKEAEKTIKVITSIPDFADMAREIGGNRVSVESLASGIEDTHGVPVRPSFAAKLSGADILIEMGLGLEHAWLPSLVDASGNQKIRGNGKGKIEVCEGITRLEIPLDLSRANGEQHAEGNPHLNICPGNGRPIATNICKGLSENFPEYKSEFEANLAKYLEKLSGKEKEWEAAKPKLKGVKFVSFHNHWPYWAEYFGMEYVGTLEPKPGVPPSGAHIVQLVKEMKGRGVKLIVREPQFSENLPKEIAAKLDGKVVKLAIMVGGLPEAKTWIDMIDINLKNMLAAVEPAK